MKATVSGVDIKDATADAMDALFAFSEAMELGEVNTNELTQVMKVAIQGGHDMLLI